MLTEFFLERARVTLSADGLSYSGTVPELPEIHIEAATPEQCHSKLAEAIKDLLASEARPDASTNGAKDTQVDFEDGVSEDQRKEQDEFQSVAISGFDEIIYEKHDLVARVTINRPDHYNSYTSTTLSEMAEAFRDARRDKSIAALVLTGAGDKAFCAGSDVSEHSEKHINNSQEFRRWFDLFVEAMEAIRELGKPSIARINGIVASGGNGWNLACDLAVAAEHAKFVQIETKFGMISAGVPAEWLTLTIGERHAREMFLMCEPVSANKALLWGLVNDVVPYTELDRAVDALCRKLSDRFPESIRYTREQLSYWKDLAWKSSVGQNREWLASQFAGEEAREGLRALAERREIDYQRFRHSEPGSSRVGQTPKTETGFDVERVCSACGASGFPASYRFCGVCGEKLL
ncbi:MAG: enoyl-CoA hydratase/isomerase family protein [Blastocatellia bacterium]